MFFGPAGEDLDDPPDLLVAADDRVELAGARLGGQVAAVLLEGGVGALRVLRGDPLAAADALERLEDRLAAGRVTLEQGLALAADLGDAQQQVLGRDVFVAEPPGLGLGRLDDPLGPRIEGQRTALDPGARGQDRGQLAAEPGQIHAQAAERLGRDAVIGLDQRGQDVLRVEDRAVEALGGCLGGDDRLLGFLGETVELHVSLFDGRGGSAGARLIDEIEEGAGGGLRLGRQVRRQDDPGLDVQVAESGGLEAGHALAGQAEGATGLGSRPGS